MFPMRATSWALGGLLLLLAGCASVPPDRPAAPKLARLAPEELQRLAPEAPKLGFPEVLAMAKSGMKAEAIIARLKESSSRLDPTPSQVLDLTRQGVPVAVLDYLHEAREKALRADLATLLTQRDQQHAQELEAQRRQEQLRNTMVCDPFWCGPGFGWPGYYRRGGMYYGW